MDDNKDKQDAHTLKKQTSPLFKKKSTDIKRHTENIYHKLNVSDRHKAVAKATAFAIYKIRVRGRLDGSWSDSLGGMQITQASGTDGQPETILVGRVIDQAMLAGILNSLYEKQLPVLSAKCVNSGD